MEIKNSNTIKDACILFMGKLYEIFNKYFIRYQNIEYEDRIVDFIKNAFGISYESSKKIYASSLLESSKFTVNYLSLGWYSNQFLQKIFEEIDVFGQDILLEEISRNNPVIILSLHMGNFYEGLLKIAEIIPVNRNFKLIKINKISQKEIKLHARISKLIKGRIEMIRVSDNNAAYEILHSLKNKEVIVMMNDVPYSNTSQSWVKYFNKLCPMQDAPARLALASKAIIIPVVCYKSLTGKMNVEFSSPIYSFGKTRSENIEFITQKIANFYEVQIKKNPEQYNQWSSLRYIVDQGKSLL